MGGGSSGGDTQIIQPPINNNVRLQEPLGNALEAQLHTMDPYSPWRAVQLLPQAPFGQVAFPGPNQTLFGNAFNPANYTASFGQAAQYPTNVGFSQGTPQYSPYWAQNTPFGQISAPLQAYFGAGGAPQGGQGQGMGGGQGNFAYQSGIQQQIPQQQAPPPPPPPQQQAPPAQPAPIPSGLTAPDPWAGTQNARTQDNPGTNWNPDGTYNPNGPYYSPPPVGPDGLPQGVK